MANSYIIIVIVKHYSYNTDPEASRNIPPQTVIIIVTPDIIIEHYIWSGIERILVNIRSLELHARYVI